MALHKIKDFDPNYRDHFDGQDIKELDLYSGDQRIGSVNDALVDEDGKFRYLIINTGAWIFGKKVMLPIGRARIDYNAHHVYADGLTKQQVEALPEFTDDLKVDYDREEEVRNIYRPSAGAAVGAMGAMGATSLDASGTLNTPTPAEGAAYTGSSMGAGAIETNADMSMARPTYDRDTYDYDMDADLYDVNEATNSSLKLYQERLIANKTRQKTGEVAVGKRVET
ncbi:MAG: PRC-barrel domain-containing protein, partial [Phormidesmis sp. CAN_BIN44]|nr:PRC-barrel domain-containing protein [Phormidesmis sp. CAN_BIN44]